MPKDLTSDSFAKLLGALSADVAEAGRLYTKLQASLVNYFELKGLSEPEQAADETIDRIPERINQKTGKEEVRFIAFSVAKFVFLEKIRKEKKRVNAADGFYAKTDAEQSSGEKDEFEPLRECFKSLYEHERDLLLNYFADLPAEELSEHRQKFADREEIDLNAVRNRVSRLRKRLEDCLKEKK
jgi:DNA-directed RNA polymerase specialized sigma24 family protein